MSDLWSDFLLFCAFVLAVAVAPNLAHAWGKYRRRTQPKRTAIKLSRTQSFAEKHRQKLARRARLDAFHRRGGDAA